MNGNYEKLVSIISKSSGLGRDEVERKIMAKRDRISGMISPEGAAQVVAAELGISFDNEKMKIADLLPGMRKVNFVGKILSISPVRKYTTKNGQEGKVVNLVVADDTSNIRTVLWDTNHISLIEQNQIGIQSVVEILNATMREEEIHLGSFSKFKPSKETFANAQIKTEMISKEKKISELKTGENAAIRGFIVQAFEPRGFFVCSECKKKVVPEGENFVCAEHGKNLGEKRFLMNFVLDDGTATIRSVIFHDNLQSIGFTLLEEEILKQQKENMLGKEMLFSGSVRMNKFFNNPEFIINGVKEINIDELIKSIGEKNAET